MSYYPTNFYSNYPYNGNQYGNQYQTSQMPIMTQIPQYQPQMQTGLQGKIVENEDVVKVTDVPIGGYGIFPKADFSEIYIKTWNGNGTTSILTFQPIIKQEVEKTSESNSSNVILEKIKQLEEKIDMLANLPKVNTAQMMLPQASTENTKRKEF